MRVILKERLTSIINEIAVNLLGNDKGDIEIPFTLVIPENVEHGDFACNVAMQLTRHLKRSPKVIAEEVISLLNDKMGSEVSCQIAGPGFINITISREWFEDTVIDIIDNPLYFHNNYGEKRKAVVEFVSANPTGPLHIGHGRGAAYGDALARVLSMSGYNVHREYYVNDAGNQMNNLALSVYVRACEITHTQTDISFPEGGYKGDYIKDIAKNLLSKEPDLLNRDKKEALELCLEAAVKDISSCIENDLLNFRVEFHNWFSEKSLYKNGSIIETLKELEKSGKTYEKDGALWLNTSSMGDDKDRVLRKSTGEYTYFTPDIAYHQDKYKRGFSFLIDIWGADHHGYIKRMECALEALGYEKESFKASLVQMVNLIQNGEKISMSTRSGEFIPLSWLIDEVGVDAARFFYNMRSHDAQFDFDIDLAKSKSNDNPVYYIQYAHARVHSLLANAKDKGIEYIKGKGLNEALGSSEVQIIKSMIRLKYTIELAAIHLEPHRISYHLQELASMFHSYYYSNKILDVENINLSCGRLTICHAVAVTIKKGLEILGVSAPERM